MTVTAPAVETTDSSRSFFGWPPEGILVGGSVVTIGVFDGFHRGHEALVRRTVEEARRLDLPAVLVTFSPHPVAILAPASAPRQLMSVDDRVAHALSLGIDTVVVLPFTIALSVQPVADFVADGLVATLGVRRLVVGDNFRCGRGGEGDIARLVRLGRRHGFRVEAVDLVEAAGEYCSSTEVRRRLARGDLAGAREMLGRDDHRVLAPC
jgi:riboflavin kinase/FMN adenylyltransferase